MKPLMPPGYARRLGRAEALKLNPVLAFSRETGAPALLPQNYEVGSIIEIYDALSWAPYKPRERDYTDFIKGFAEGLSRAQTVHLVFFDDRGNGHLDYKIVAGPEPRVKPHGGTRKQRRAAKQRKLQKTGKALAFYDWYNAEAKRLCAILG